MNLRNYDNYVASKQLITSLGRCVSMGEHTNFADGHLTVKTTSAEIYRIYGSSNTSYGGVNLFWEQGSAASGLVCGGGDTAVTYDDYKLDVPFTDSSSVSYVSSEFGDTIYDEATNTFQRTMKKIFSAKTDLVIKEIGFITSIPTRPTATSSTGSDYYCLVFRKVLDEPVSVEENSNFELTFTSIVSACANKPTDYDASVTTE